eukprot:1211463-Prymnesium_polylepis.1
MGRVGWGTTPRARRPQNAKDKHSRAALANTASAQQHKERQKNLNPQLLRSDKKTISISFW